MPRRWWTYCPQRRDTGGRGEGPLPTPQRKEKASTLALRPPGPGGYPPGIRGRAGPEGSAGRPASLRHPSTLPPKPNPRRSEHRPPAPEPRAATAHAEAEAEAQPGPAASRRDGGRPPRGLPGACGWAAARLAPPTGGADWCFPGDRRRRRARGPGCCGMRRAGVGTRPVPPSRTPLRSRLVARPRGPRCYRRLLIVVS